MTRTLLRIGLATAAAIADVLGTRRAEDEQIGARATV